MSRSLRFPIFLLERPEAECHVWRLEGFLLRSWPFVTQIGLVAFVARYFVDQRIELSDDRSLVRLSQSEVGDSLQ